MGEGNLENNEIKLMDYAADICNEFENLLEQYDITIPDEYRSGEEDEARLFGAEYSNMLDYITDILCNLVREIKERPDAKINTTEY